jgi:predicted Zn-dependent protease
MYTTNNFRFGALLAFGIALSGCMKNAATGRNQLSLVSNEEMLATGQMQYRDFLQKNKVVAGTRQADEVKNIGRRISNAVTAYYASAGKSELLKGYNWEYNLVDNKEPNAWCMPGGKIVVYTGILPITQNADALAVVLGHEIAHAIAQHSRERVSQQLISSGSGMLFSSLFAQNQQQAENIFMAASGISTVGFLLPHSRKQELEADKLGLVYAAIAGYNPSESIPFWERMGKLSNGQSPPEFASTHPTEAKRIAQLKAMLPEVMPLYEKAKGRK